MVFSVAAVKNTFAHPALAYNFLISGIPNVPSLNVKGAQIPGKRVENIIIKFRGRDVHFNGNIGRFDDFNITVFEDISYTARTMLELWQQIMADNSTGFGFATPVITKNIDVFLLAPGTEHVIAAYELHNAFPHTIASVDLDYDSVEQPLAYQVSFAYDFWTRKDVQGFSSIDDVKAALGLA